MAHRTFLRGDGCPSRACLPPLVNPLSDYMTGVLASDEALPPSLVRAIQQRLTRLSTEVLNHLRVTAIVGRSFDLALLAEVIDTDVESTEEILLSTDFVLP